MTDYQRKLYAFLHALHPDSTEPLPAPFGELACWENLEDLHDWWEQHGGKLTGDIAAASDRINLDTNADLPDEVEVRHPISGQRQTITKPSSVPPLPERSRREQSLLEDIPAEIQRSTDAEQVFWWFWRFYPEYLAKANSQALLYPAHRILPDCPLHSYQSTVSALVGALSNQDAEKPEDRIPYLLLFSFSPVQEFIKASRKFLDFWAGSYLLHHLSARLCWYVADKYGPDAVIVPSLWGQDIFDAFTLRDKYPDFAPVMACLADGRTPVARFDDRISNSLSTAGFPNMITALVPGKEAAEKLGQDLSNKLVEEWRTISEKIRDDIRDKVITFLTDDQHQTAREELWREFEKSANPELYRQEMELLQQQNCWEWRHLWEAQIDNTWEPYWAAVPLGNPEKDLLIKPEADQEGQWAKAQDAIAWPPTDLPSEAERRVYQKELNVGTWWGSLQQRLRTAHMAVKNTRHWKIPAAPGPRSTLSGQFSALHPRLNYQKRQLRNGETRDFREGGGLPESSMRLFWLIMSYAYKGLFNGSEMLNALELTKRMAWQFGGVAESMGISTALPVLSPEDYEDEDKADLHLQESRDEIDYEQLIRFPNLSSIAAARFMYESYNQPNSKLRAYWRVLKKKIGSGFENAQHQAQFAARTRGRPTHVWKTDNRINPSQAKKGKNYNGVMFSSKWLADDLNLEKHSENGDGNEVATLRRLVDEAHRHDEVNLGDGSPGDWWVIVLGDGDGMGSYISGETLKAYQEYLIDLEPNHYFNNRQGIDPAEFACHFYDLLDTPKRMGPATHIGLNRALLDFSNRLVPYLTEKRYCGRVIYSGGDDVMAVLPLEDLPGYLRSLRAAWSGGPDPDNEFLQYAPSTSMSSEDRLKGSGYWHPKAPLEGIPFRPHFTMGQDATMSLGIVIANKAVPLPTVLESLWDAEKTAKAMPGKDGLCFRVIYGGGNTLEALMKGELLDDWWALIDKGTQTKDGQDDLSPMLYRLAEELPKRASVTKDYNLFAEAAKVIVSNRDESKQFDDFEGFCDQLMAWLKRWEAWVKTVDPKQLQPGYDPRQDPPLTGTSPDALGYLLRFSAFWVSKNAQRRAWVQPVEVKS
ncbi:hypothetical protein XM38_007080 [Halomicronema hongdechloris C2206]|uniref:Uncharacterized protein n=1 Tax=Halomicronema hongdechloris C2206 TaxID=1641165 RepID=A0A1Z3HHI2_9CYAN|nr:type III-B CRISPR-associated protein Cas10/Cmr2 [Halomicronema hongdechloris]ASC69779.1 hypothetical protein XM38_007080 [Halomicronema hongdechloris C2206]